MGKEILLTITMLVSNRPDTIEKCLSSMQPLLNAIPSELIVVDTAGNEECMEIVRKFTDNIVRFEWCNDFAAARNAGLKKAKGKWVMYIDDDEWFEDITELIDFFKNETYKNYHAAAYVTRNYINTDGKAYNNRTAVRLCEMTAETEFIGRIHEQLNPLFEPTYYAKAYVHHYGYAFDTQEELYKHSWRNINMLTEARMVERDNWMAGAHLLQEYFAVKEYFSLIAVAKEMRATDACYEWGRVDFTSYAAVQEMQSYIQLKRFEEAYELGKQFLAEDRLLINAHLFIASMMAQVSVHCGKSKDCLQYTKLFWELFEKWNANLDECYARDPFSLRERYLNEADFANLRMIELHAHVEEKNWEEAKETFEKIRWAFAQTTLGGTFKDIIDLIINTEYNEKYTEGMTTLLLGKGTQQYIEREIDAVQGEDREKVLRCVSEVPSAELVVMQYKLQYAVMCRDEERVGTVLQQWTELNYSLFFPDKDFWKGLREMQMSLKPWIGEIGIHEWITLTEALFDRFEKEDCENVYFVLSRGLKQTDIRMMHLTALQLEKQLLSKNMNLENVDFSDMEEIWRELYRIASLWVSCAAMLYQDTVFQGELQSALPPRYRFSWLIFQANAVREDTLGFVRKVAEAAKNYLAMEAVCKYILKYYRSESEE